MNHIFSFKNNLFISFLFLKFLVIPRLPVDHKKALTRQFPELELKKNHMYPSNNFQLLKNFQKYFLF